MILIETDVVVVDAEVDVETSVPIVVRNCSLRKTPLRIARKLEGIAFDRILSLSLIKKEQRAAFGNNKQVLHAFVLEIGEESARGVIENIYSRPFGDVLERSVPKISVEPIRETRRLTHIEIIQAIVVDIAHS